MCSIYVIGIFICYRDLILLMSHIQGIVIDNRGNPVENATITIPSAGRFALSADDGFFEIDGILGGLHRINVIHRNFQKFGADVRILEDTDITITLDQTSFGY